MWVKICANTNLEDALLAARLGADAVGFVFAPSTRQVIPTQVARITPHLPPGVGRVGVFPAWAAGAIVSAVAEAGLTAVQLHAAYNSNLAQSLRQALPSTVQIIQAIHWDVAAHHEAEAAILHLLQQVEASNSIDRILVDSRVGSASGGTGKPFDWTAAQAVFDKHPQLILAGGLQPQNVREAMNHLRPWGVDVASGVEKEPGRKDPERLKRFIEEAKSPA